MDPAASTETKSWAMGTCPKSETDLNLSLYQLSPKMMAHYEMDFQKIPVLWKHDKRVQAYPIFKLVFPEVPQSFTALTFWTAPHRSLSYNLKPELSFCSSHQTWLKPRRGEQIPALACSRFPLQLHTRAPGKEQCCLLSLGVQGWENQLQKKQNRKILYFISGG